MDESTAFQRIEEELNEILKRQSEEEIKYIFWKFIISPEHQLFLTRSFWKKGTYYLIFLLYVYISEFFLLNFNSYHRLRLRHQQQRVQQEEEGVAEDSNLHRRRIKTEEKAKMSSLLFGRKNLFNSLRISCFALDNLNYRMNCTRMIWKKRMISSYSSKSS